MVVELQAIKLFLFEPWFKYAIMPWFDNFLDWCFGGKHDGIKARRENPKLDENHNFSIMKSSMKPKDREIFSLKFRDQLEFIKSIKLIWTGA